MENVKELQADAVVVGTGPGGSTVAKELTALGKRVVMLERGRDHQFYGNFLGTALMADRMGFKWSKEGLNAIRALTTGGSTMIYGASAIMPPDWLTDEYGIDLKTYVEETKAELSISPLPESHIGESSRHIMNAARELGMNWSPVDKFINAEKCTLDCSCCMYGCKKGAKWTARNFAYQARDNGATLVNRARVDRVMVENAQAVGVTASTPRGPLRVMADTVVIAAGGMGTPGILNRSGLDEAGRGFIGDPLIISTGCAEKYQGPGMRADITMCGGTFDYMAEGILIADLIDPWPSHLLQLFYKGISHIPKILKHHRLMGVMCKISDSIGGRVFPDESFSKALAVEDRQKLDRGAFLNEKILAQAGCKPGSIVHTPVRLGHPGGTARIGHIVNIDLETQIKHLFVCDNSITPQPYGLPPVLMLIAMGKRLVKTRLQTIT